LPSHQGIDGTHEPAHSVFALDVDLTNALRCLRADAKVLQEDHDRIAIESLERMSTLAEGRSVEEHARLGASDIVRRVTGDVEVKSEIPVSSRHIVAYKLDIWVPG